MKKAIALAMLLTLAACAARHNNPYAMSAEQARFESWARTCARAGSTQPHWCASKMLAREQQRAAAATAARYQEQEDFDQWAASCKNAESYNPARCAATMHTISKRAVR